jgi:hypothetical protein
MFLPSQIDPKPLPTSNFQPKLNKPMTDEWKELQKIAMERDDPTLAVLVAPFWKAQDPKGYAAHLAKLLEDDRREVLEQRNVVYAPAMAERLGISVTHVGSICASLGYKLLKVSGRRCWVRPGTEHPRVYLWEQEGLK